MILFPYSSRGGNSDLIFKNAYIGGKKKNVKKKKVLEK